MTVLLSCPRCGLTTRTSDLEADQEACPRCLARTSGALSVYMRAKRGPAAGKSTGRLGFTSRLLRRQTAS
jgi:hypothetical protein